MGEDVNTWELNSDLLKESQVQVEYLEVSPVYRQ